MADPGWVGAYGAAGGYDYLAKLIAERKKDEILQQQAYEYERSQALREQEAQQRAEEFRLNNERLAKIAEREAIDRGELRLGQRAERITKNTPIGAQLGIPQIATLAATDQQGLVGARPITQQPGLIETPGGAPTPATAGPVTGGESIYTGTYEQQQDQVKAALDQARYEATVARDAAREADNEADRRIALARLDLAERNLQRLTDRPNQALVGVMTVDENGVPVTKFVPKVAGAEYERPPTAAQQTQATETEAALGGLAELRTLYRPEWVGPLAGRIAKTKTLTTGGEPGQAEFLSQIATVKNRVIKAITGAQMSEPEARRIMEQIPDETLPPSTFEARMNATEKNYQMLLDIIRRRGTGGAPATPRSPAAGAGDPMGILGP